jgi:hypothetical protein
MNRAEVAGVAALYSSFSLSRHRRGPVAQATHYLVKGRPSSSCLSALAVAPHTANILPPWVTVEINGDDNRGGRQPASRFVAGPIEYAPLIQELVRLLVEARASCRIRDSSVAREVSATW